MERLLLNVMFGRIAQQVVGKSILSLMKRWGSEGDCCYCHSKFTLSVSISQKSLMQGVVSFQVNGVEAFLRRQACLPDIQDYDDDDATTLSSSHNDGNLWK